MVAKTTSYLLSISKLFYYLVCVLVLQILPLYCMSDFPETATANDVMFFRAIKVGDLQNINRGVNKVNLAARDKKGQTALHKTAIANNQDLAIKLLNRGACIAVLDNEDLTPMHYLLKHENISLLEKICEHLNKEGQVRCLCGKNNCTLASLQNSMGQTLLHYVVSQNYLNGAQFLLKYKLNVNAKSTVVYGRGQTPLFIAASNGYLRMVELLIQHGADITVVDSKGLQACYYSAEKQHTGCPEYQAITKLLNPAFKLEASGIQVPTKISVAQKEEQFDSIELDESVTSNSAQSLSKETTQRLASVRWRLLRKLFLCTSSKSSCEL